MSNIVAYMPLHYGLPYMEAAIQSIIGDVDRLIIIYSATGSHGSTTDAAPPDSYSDLYRIARDAAGAKLEWYSHHGFGAENDQRMSVMNYLTPDDEFLVPLDSDEIWDSGLLVRAIEIARHNPDVRVWRLPMRHYWRSFSKGIESPDLPDRLINLKPAGDMISTIPAELGIIHHMGYAQPTRYIEYKWRIHGHKHEQRRDIDWFKERWLANAQSDVHPVGNPYWNTFDIEPDSLPELLRNRPYFGMDVIE